jgi:hypothetical protein
MNAAGDRIAIGARGNDGNGINAGHTRVYEWNGIVWTQMGIDIDGEDSVNYSGSSVSFNDLGNRLAIGAPGNGANGRGSGHVRIYEWNTTAWIQMGMDIDGEDSLDQSGYSVSMNAAGDRIAIGANENDGNGSNAGHVRMFQWDGISWVQMGADIDGEAIGDGSGRSVNVNGLGDRLVVGAIFNNGNGTGSGHARVYQNNLSTNISEVENESSVSIYPNPANESLTLETHRSVGEIAQITAITGALLFEFKVTKAQEKIDVSGFQNGIYFLKIGEVTRKVIVAH